MSTNISFLVDTGAEVSIVLPTHVELKRQPNRSLIAANGTPIRSYGTRPMELTLNHTKFTWRFQVAKAHIHIIGADFIRAYGLVVDLTHKQLIRLKDLSILRGTLKNAISTKITSLAKISELAELLQGHPELTTPKFELSSPKHHVQHHIVTKGPPVHAQAQCLAPE